MATAIKSKNSAKCRFGSSRVEVVNVFFDGKHDFKGEGTDLSQA